MLPCHGSYFMVFVVKKVNDINLRKRYYKRLKMLNKDTQRAKGSVVVPFDQS